MDPKDSYLYTDPTQQVDNPLTFDERTLSISDPLQIDIPEKELLDITKKRVEESEKFYEEAYNLKARRAKNEMYLFGRQVGQLEKDGKLKNYEARSSDNALYEIEATLKPLAMSKLPDILVTPGRPDPERIQSAKDLTIVVNDTNKQRAQRETVALAFKHLPVYFTAVVKAKWDSEKGIDGDFSFPCIHPEYIIVDHTCTSRNVDDMGFIAQCVPTTVEGMFIQFPKMRNDDKLREALGANGIEVGGDPTYKALASEVKLWEVHYDWYVKNKGEDKVNPEDVMNGQDMKKEKVIDPQSKWTKKAGVLWRYQDCILDNIPDPNYDWEGEMKLFTYDTPGDETTKHEVNPQDIVMAQLSGQPLPSITQEKIYHNYFNRPHKPYYFFGYDQWGKVYLDETSRIEQNIRNQENLDDQNKTIIDQLKQRIKHIWSTESGLTKSAVQRLDMDNPKMDVVVAGDPNKVHQGIEPERPASSQFNALSGTRDRMYAVAGSYAVRGQMQSDTATTNQIAREADFTRSDDLVEDTVNACYEWMGEWMMQFIKLRYTDDHFKEILGPNGDITYIRLRRDSIANGMEVMIKASATDKLKAQRNAMDTAQLGPPYTNPIDFFQDMDMSDPAGRVQRGMALAIDPNMYYTKYVMNLDTTGQQAGALAAGTPQMPPQMPPQPQGAQPPQPMPQPPMMPPPPQQPSPMDTSTVPAQPPVGPPMGSPRGL